MSLVELTCEVCGKVFMRNSGEVTRNKKLGRRVFCSLQCTGKASIGNLPEVRKTDHLPKGKVTDEYSPFRKYLEVIRQRVKIRGEELSITLEDIKQQWEKQNGVCPFTGWKLDIPRTTMWSESPLTPRRASLDRIDSSIGYVPGNIRFVSVMANYCKNAFIDKDVFEFCQAVVEYQVQLDKNQPPESE
jgi:hypothetical protein